MAKRTRPGLDSIPPDLKKKKIRLNPYPARCKPNLAGGQIGPERQTSSISLTNFMKPIQIELNHFTPYGVLCQKSKCLKVCFYLPYFASLKFSEKKGISIWSKPNFGVQIVEVPEAGVVGRPGPDPHPHNQRQHPTQPQV